jgi:hypothetical protein
VLVGYCKVAADANIQGIDKRSYTRCGNVVKYGHGKARETAFTLLYGNWEKHMTAYPIAGMRWWQEIWECTMQWSHTLWRPELFEDTLGHAIDGCNGL